MALTSPTLPINDLPGFIGEVEKLFDNVIESWNQLLFPETNRTLISQAWTELKPTLSSIRDALLNPIPTIADKLRNAGLAVGKQLDLKLKMLNDAWERFKKRGTVRLLKELLDWINKLLGSLADVVPGGEALKEFKEVLEKGIA
jgi:hypothetical protein